MGVRTSDIDTAAVGATPSSHAASHQDGGSDEFNAAGISGVLASAQVADKIKTSGVAVSINSTAPIAGQTIVASSSTAAAWGSAAPATKLQNVGNVDENANASLAGAYLRWAGTAAAVGVYEGIPSAPQEVSGGTRFYIGGPAINGVTSVNDNSVYTLSSTPVVTSQSFLSKAVPNTGDLELCWAFLYDTPLNVTQIPAGPWSCNTYHRTDIWAGDALRYVRQIVYSVLTRDGGTSVTVATTGSGTSRTCTASGGTPFATTKIIVGSQPAATSYVQTPNGLYRITARISDTQVTLSTPSGYTNESAVTFNVWSLIAGIMGSGDVVVANTDANGAVYPFAGVNPAITLTTAHKLGLMTFCRSSPARTLDFIYGHIAYSGSLIVPLQRPATALRLAQTTSNSPAVNTLCKLALAGSNQTVNLPTQHTAGDTIKVKMTTVAGGNTITIDPAGAQTIDGAATYVMSTSFQAVTCESDGTNWLIT